jgi:hypothetical protein
MVSVMGEFKVKTKLDSTQKVALIKVTNRNQRKAKIQRICLKPRATKPCLNQHYLYHLALPAINQIVKIQRDLMKVEVILLEPIATQTVRIEAEAEAVDLSCHQRSLRLIVLFKNKYISQK